MAVEEITIEAVDGTVEDAVLKFKDLPTRQKLLGVAIAAVVGFLAEESVKKGYVKALVAFQSRFGA